MDDDDDEWVQMMIMMTATATTTATPATSFYLCVYSVDTQSCWRRCRLSRTYSVVGGGGVALTCRCNQGNHGNHGYRQQQGTQPSLLTAPPFRCCFHLLLAAFLNCLRGRFLCPRCRRRCVEAQEACPRCRRRCVEALRALRQQWARSLGAGGVGQHAFPQQWARSLVEPVDVQYLFAILASDPVLHCVRATACLLLVRAPLLRRFRRHRTGENEKHNSVTRAR